MVVVRDRTGRRGRLHARLDAQERVANTDQQPAGGRVFADGVRPEPGPEFHQAGRTEESSEGTGADVDNAGGDYHQHGAVQTAAAHRSQDHGPPPAPEPHRRSGAALQVVRHAHLHQRVLVGHTRAAAKLQNQEDQHIQKLRHPSHHRHETVDAHTHRSVTRTRTVFPDGCVCVPSKKQIHYHRLHDSSINIYRISRPDGIKVSVLLSISVEIS